MTRTWVVAIVFGVLCVVAIAGVVYGVATHEEAGFADERPGWQRSVGGRSVRGSLQEASRSQWRPG